MTNLYKRKETYKPEEVLNFLPKKEDYPRNFKLKKIKKDYDGDEMKMASDRYYTFEKSLKCSHCDLEGSFFAKERHSHETGSYHFNLYAIDKDGNEVLMTKDHIIPKSKGGKNIISNYNTQCTICNHIKQDTDETVALENAKLRIKDA